MFTPRRDTTPPTSRHPRFLIFAALLSLILILAPANRAQQDTDPLGRPLRGRDYGDDTTVRVPGEVDAQRARRIIEELRRRFGEAFRPQLELDYIERLLKDY